MARQNDLAAIGELFSRYWRAARAAAFGVTGDFASAEDAAAEAFTQALSGIQALRDPDRFGAWLRTIVVRKARLAVQARQATVEVMPDDHANLLEGPDRALERQELAALLHRAVRLLPEALREAVALFYFEGYDSDAAARFLDVPPGTLRRRLHDGRAQLRLVIEDMLQGSTVMREERERQIERFTRLMEGDRVYQALRESLALRPPPVGLIDRLLRRRLASERGLREEPTAQAVSAVRDIARRFLEPSARTSDPSHPVGSTAIAIQNALPHFQHWAPDAGEAAARFFTFTGDRRDRFDGMLPPGFAEGRPGAFLRATRACLILDETGSARSVFEQLQASPDEESFRSAGRQMMVSDALDLVWMVAGALDLRAIHDVLERLVTVVLPGAAFRFSSFDEPRYRSGLQLHVGDVAVRAASGGVLGDWPGRPQDVGAAHVRLFLEPWATIRSGRTLDFEKFLA